LHPGTWPSYASIASTVLPIMSAITIRNIDDSVVTAIKRRAADRGLSMEEEVRRLLVATYFDDRQERGRAWARRQLGRLEHRELPIARVSSAEEIWAMRRERTAGLERSSKKDDERRR
jgi:plasmid stability protein